MQQTPHIDSRWVVEPLRIGERREPSLTDLIRLVMTMLILLTTLLTTACGKLDELFPQTEPPPPFELDVPKSTSFNHPIVGRWESNCIRSKSGEYVVNQSAFGDRVFRSIVTIYQGTACEKPRAEIRSEGTFELRAAENTGASLIPGAEALDLHHTSVHYVPRTSLVTIYANDKHYCGLTDWRLNQPKEVTGIPGCSDAIDLFTLVHLSATPNTLSLGELTDELDGKTPDKRPVTISHDLTLSRME